MNGRLGQEVLFDVIKDIRDSLQGIEEQLTQLNEQGLIAKISSDEDTSQK